ERVGIGGREGGWHGGGGSGGERERKRRWSAGRERRMVESQLGAEWTQVDRFQIESSVARLDRDRPRDPSARMPSEVGLSMPHHGWLSQRSVSPVPRASQAFFGRGSDSGFGGRFFVV